MHRLVCGPIRTLFEQAFTQIDDQTTSLFGLNFGGALVVVGGVLLEDPVARMQMPWNLREITGRCCRLAISSGNRSEGLVSELSLGFCATGLDGVPVSRGVFVGLLVR